MSPKIKFSLMSFFSLAGLVGFVVLLCNANSIYAAAKGIAGFWVGLIAVIALFEVLLFFSVSTGMTAFSALNNAEDDNKEAERRAAEKEARRRAEEEEAARRAAEEEARRKAEEEEAARRAAEEAARTE